MTLSGIKKHLNFYVALNKAQLMVDLAYRGNTIMVTLASYGYNIVALIFLKVLFDNFNNIAGWEKYEVMFMYGFGQIVFYMYYMLFLESENISDKIQTGEIDQILLQPINSLFRLSSNKLNLVEMVPSSLLSLAIYYYAGMSLGFSAGKLTLVSIPLILISTVIVNFVKINIGLLAFWFTDTTDLRRLHSGLVDKAQYPLDIYPKSIRGIFFTIIPIGINAYIPCFFILRGFDFQLFGYYLFSFIFFFVTLLILWKKGLKNYSSVSG